MSNTSNTQLTGCFFIIVGPSGVGKDALLDAVRTQLLDRDNIEIVSPKSYTTRPQRAEDPAEKKYIFVNNDEFNKHMVDGEILECTISHGHLYGMSCSDFENSLANSEGKTMVKGLDYNGARFIKKQYPKNTTTIFIRPPSLEALSERLINRGDRTASEADFQCRILDNEAEIRLAGDFDYVITNNDFRTASDILYSVIKTTLDAAGSVTRSHTLPDGVIASINPDEPHLITERLVLRRYNPDTDIHQMYRICSAPGFGESMGWHHHTSVGDTLRFLYKMQKKPWSLAICLRGTNGDAGEIIGMISISPDPFRKSNNAQMLKLSITEQHRRHGYAVEAGRALLNYARNMIGSDTITAVHYIGNEAAASTFKALGFANTGVLRAGDTDPLGVARDVMLYARGISPTNMLAE